MLANNICDVAEDVKIGRKTLPYYTGRKTALTILCGYYVLAYIFLILGIVLKYLPVITLGSLLTIPLVYHTTKTFVKNPHKESTFTGILVNVLLEIGRASCRERAEPAESGGPLNVERRLQRRSGHRGA